MLKCDAKLSYYYLKVLCDSDRLHIVINCKDLAISIFTLNLLPVFLKFTIYYGQQNSNLNIKLQCVFLKQYAPQNVSQDVMWANSEHAILQCQRAITIQTKLRVMVIV